MLQGFFLDCHNDLTHRISFWKELLKRNCLFHTTCQFFEHFDAKCFGYVNSKYSVIIFTITVTRIMKDNASTINLKSKIRQCLIVKTRLITNVMCKSIWHIRKELDYYTLLIDMYNMKCRHASSTIYQSIRR